MLMVFYGQKWFSKATVWINALTCLNFWSFASKNGGEKLVTHPLLTLSGGIQFRSQQKSPPFLKFCKVENFFRSETFWLRSQRFFVYADGSVSISAGLEAALVRKVRRP
jgi:hypothetical protein